jgi:glyoxylase-like metal-dependent hydrolase (beta-lactamase superfamily II)
MRLTQGIHLVGSGEIGLSDAWDAHVYVLDGGDELALIDAGCGQRSSLHEILEHVRADGLEASRISKLLLTHWHPDHAGGAAGVRQRLGLKVCASEQAVIEAGAEGLPPCTVDEVLSHGAAVQVGSLSARALVVPGHSSGSTCYLVDVPGGRALFTGDAVFMNGILGLLNHPDSSLDAYRTFFSRVDGLQIDMLLPGHMLFILRGAQRHLDWAVEALEGGFVPYSVGQLGIDFRPPLKM